MNSEKREIKTLVGAVVSLSLFILSVVLTSCSDKPNQQPNVQGSLAALSMSGSLLPGAVVTQIGPYNDIPRAIMVLPDGKILIAGASYDEKLVDLFITRYDRSGRLDSSFGNSGIVTSPIGSGNDRVAAMVMQNDGSILVVGGTHNGQDLDTSVRRYNLDGTLDSSFAQGGIFKLSMGIGNDMANAVVVQNDGKIVIAGTGHDATGIAGYTVIRLNGDGSLDSSFANNGTLVLRLGTPDSQTNDVATQLALDGSGRILVLGTVMNGAQSELGMVRLTPAGARDTTFGTQGQLIIAVTEADDEPTAVAIQPDQKILVAVSVFQNGRRNAVVYRLQDNGGFDDFGEQSRATGGALSTVNQIQILSDGRILLAGSFYNADTRSDFAVERYLASGYIDPAFGKLGRVQSAVSKDNDAIQRLALTGDNHMLALGTVHETDKKLGMCLVRYDSEGLMDSRFGSDSFL